MKRNKGFTLVELLIVIALIGILAVAIVATINPIEQINRARDARFKNDASELLAAIERYYASVQEYPWSAQDSSFTVTSGFAALGTYEGIGVCAPTVPATPDADTEGDCTSDGVLISNDELKTQFRSKEQFTTTSDLDRIYVWKAANDSSVYVCFIPKAQVNQTLSGAELKDLNIGAAGGVPTQYEDADAADVTAAGWNDASDSLFICVPE